MAAVPWQPAVSHECSVHPGASSTALAVEQSWRQGCFFIMSTVELTRGTLSIIVSGDRGRHTLVQ
jgi:hypothetical protein